MQGVGAVVDRQRVFLAVERELALGDAVAVAADQRAEVRAVLDVIGQVVVAEHHVAEVAVAVGHLQEDDEAAVIADAGLGALVVAQRVEVHRGAVLRLAEGLHGDLSLLWGGLFGPRAAHERGRA